MSPCAYPFSIIAVMWRDLTWPRKSPKFHLHHLRNISTQFKMAMLTPKSGISLHKTFIKVFPTHKMWSKSYDITPHKEVKHIMIIAIVYIFLSHVIFDQQLKLLSQNPHTPSPWKKSTHTFLLTPLLKIPKVQVPPVLPTLKIFQVTPHSPSPWRKGGEHYEAVNYYCKSPSLFEIFIFNLSLIVLMLAKNVLSKITDSIRDLPFSMLAGWKQTWKLPPISQLTKIWNFPITTS